MKNDRSRRIFLKKSVLGLAGAGVVFSGDRVIGREAEKMGDLKIKEKRLLGRTGFKTTDIASGGPSDLAVLNFLLDSGVNYIDTAESYSKGQSEIITGQGLKNRDRKSIFVNSKLHIKKDETKESILKRAYKCLERLDTPYLDCMMIHSCANSELVKSKAFHDAMDQLKKEKKLRYVGISNHNGPNPKEDLESMEKVLMAAVEDGRFDVMLLVYNFLQKDAAERVIKACKAKNIGVTLMKTNPVGKYLNMKERVAMMEKEGKNVSGRMRERLESMKKDADGSEPFIKKYNLQNPIEIRAASTRYVLANPDVDNVLCRCSSFEDADHFLGISGTKLTDKESKKLAAFEKGFGKWYCRHACSICESSCPQGVQVNTIMRYSHYFESQRLEKYAMGKYAGLSGQKASKCDSCQGNCEAKCPHNVPVQALLAFAHQRLDLA